MKKLAIGVITVSLAIIAFVMSYRLWADHKQAREADTALANIEANKPPRFKAEIPTPGSNPSEATNTLFVSVDSKGALKINDEPAGTLNDTSQVRARLSQIVQNRNDKSVTLKASSKLKYEGISKLIGEIKEVGASSVSVQIDDSIATN
jgi:biopolymer transport protein ExbD